MTTNSEGAIKVSQSDQLCQSKQDEYNPVTVHKVTLMRAIIISCGYIFCYFVTIRFLISFNL